MPRALGTAPQDIKALSVNLIVKKLQWSPAWPRQLGSSHQLQGMMHRSAWHQCCTSSAPKVRAYNDHEVLGGELQPEIQLVQGVKARWAEEYDSVAVEEDEMVVVRVTSACAAT